MSDPRITDEAVEAAAIAACEFVYPPKTHHAWDDVDDFEQDSWRATERVALEAAMPLLVPQMGELADALLTVDGYDVMEGDEVPERELWAVVNATRKVLEAAPLPLDREALEALAAEWKWSADVDERYLNKAHASEIHDVYASIRINREHADAVLALINGGTS